VSVDALATEPETEVKKIGEKEPADLQTSGLFDPEATARVVMLGILTPSISAVASVLPFRFAPIYG